MGSTKRKRCTGCDTVKELDAFALNPTKNCPNARRSRCRECQANYRRGWAASGGQARIGETNRVWATKNPEKVKQYSLISRLRKHGLTLADYERMLAAQNDLCAICREEPMNGPGKSFHLDHDHVTGEVRGLLCNNCNLLLGFARDRVDVLTGAIEYLYSRRTPSEHTGTE